MERPLSTHVNSGWAAAELRGLGRALCAGAAEHEVIAARVLAALVQKQRLDGAGTSASPAKVLLRVRRFADGLAGRYLAWRMTRSALRPRLVEVEGFLAADRWVQRWVKLVQRSGVRPALLAEGNAMQPAPVAAGWDVPEICSVEELARWLRVDAGELEWFTDLKGLLARRGADARLGHYHYRFHGKAAGGVRLIEAPKDRLKLLQRQVLREIVERVPVHAAAHGFVRGRSIRSFAEPHVGRRVVLRMDVEDFFPSVAGGRVMALFRMVGYPEMVADRLGGLCTTATPGAVWAGSGLCGDALGEVRGMYGRRHLPQGAPSSPALANVCAYRMDCRLSGLARAAGATYTRYADDLAFSGDDDFERGVERFALHVAAIVSEEGFRVQHRKTRVMRQGVRQHLAGLVVNERMHVGRAEFDRLKAILTNCVRHGAESQNREGLPYFRLHLEGRVGFVESVHAARGARLREILGRVRWD